MKNIFENAKIAIFIVNKEGIIQNLNPSAEAQTRKLKKELTGKKFLKSFPELRTGKNGSGFSDIISNPDFQYGSYYSSKFGFNYEITAYPSSGKVIVLIRNLLNQVTVERKLNERIKELTTLYQASRIFQDDRKYIGETLGDFVSILPKGWQYTEITAACISLGEVKFTTPNYTHGVHKQSRDFVTSYGLKVSIEVLYLEEKPDEFEGPFLEEERKLLDMLADMLRIYLDRRMETEELKKSEANLRTIFDNTDTAYILLDTHFNIILSNSIARQWGVGNSGNITNSGQYIFETIPEDFKEEALRIYEDVLNGKHYTYEINFSIKERGIRWYYIRLSPILGKDGKKIGLCIAADDITERKIAEVEKEKITNDLFQRNKDLAQFSYVVSHNLRSPVANIMGFSDILKKDKHDAGQTKIFIEQLHASSQKLDGVIKDLNFILQVKGDVDNKKEIVVLSELFDDIQSSIKSLIDKENALIITDFKEAGELFTLKGYLHSIFYNLITNSIKYRKPDIAPVIEVKSVFRNDKIIISFRDNGTGIDMLKNGADIFGLYKRFHSDIEGKGIGLFMVKTQVDTLGGKIDIESEVNKGTKFIIEFNK